MTHCDAHGSSLGHDSVLRALPFEWFQIFLIPEYITWLLSLLKVICHSLPAHRFVSASWSLSPPTWVFTSRKKLIPSQTISFRKMTCLGNRGIHIRKKIFKCPECGKTFPENKKFVLHLQSHVAERPYGCKKCGRRFGRLSNCTRHEKTHLACKTRKQKWDRERSDGPASTWNVL